MTVGGESSEAGPNPDSKDGEGGQDFDVDSFLRKNGFHDNSDLFRLESIIEQAPEDRDTRNKILNTIIYELLKAGEINTIDKIMSPDSPP